MISKITALIDDLTNESSESVEEIQNSFKESYRYPMFLAELEILKKNISLISKFITMFDEDSQETLETRKVFFMDNMTDIKRSLTQLTGIIGIINSDTDPVARDVKLIEFLNTSTKLQEDLKKHILDLNREMLNDDLDNKPSITMDNIQEAKNNNAGTKRLISEVKASEQEEAFNSSFKKLNNVNKNTNNKYAPIKKAANTCLIVNLDTGVVVNTLSVNNPNGIPVADLNKALAQCGSGNLVAFVCDKYIPLKQTTTVQV